MAKEWVGRLLLHGMAVVVFLSVAFAYCRPVYENKVLVQEDVTQWRAMARNSFEYKEKHGHFPLWTNGMFSGMPTYQIAMDAGAYAPQYFVYDSLMSLLKKPANFFFLACLCFYFLTQVLRVNPCIGIVGALTYAYATYNPVIVAVGHDTKMQCIAVLPAFIAGLVLLFDGKYWWGAALTALGTALVVAVNHLQIFYYGLLIAAVMTIGYAVRWIRAKEYQRLLLSGALATGSVLIGVLSNAVVIFTTADFAKATIRGGSELAEAGSMVGRSGLSTDYAFSYSMFPTEPFTLLAPKIFGGSDGSELPDEKSRAVGALMKMPLPLAQRLQTDLSFYWGGIGTTAGPSYAGAVICALALLGFFVLDNRHKWWIGVACLLAIFMSWGGYFASFNGLLLRILPMYDKFRAPSVILIIPVLLLGMLAMLTLQRIWEMSGKEDFTLWRNYQRGMYLVAGIFGILVVLYFGFDYTSGEDRLVEQRWASSGEGAGRYVQTFLRGLREDRQNLFLGSLERSFLFVAAALLLTGLVIKRRIPRWAYIGLVGVLAFIDVMGVSWHYLNHGSYKDEAAAPPTPLASAADRQVLRDSGYYRVLDLRQGLGTALTYGAQTAWWHHSVGGYNPAKLSIYEDLIEHQLQRYPACEPVLDMLNTRYIIQPDGRGGDTVVKNDGALGAAWFVRGIRYEPDARAVINGLTGFATRDSALLFEKDRSRVSAGWQADSGARIYLIQNDNDLAVYRTTSKTPQFAVFSEVFYDRGWKAFLDGDEGNVGKELPIIRTNYVLRGLSIPAGNHEIRMIFHPSSYYAGQLVQRIGGTVLFMLLLSPVGIALRRKINGRRRRTI